jgi:hypothetical protein
MSIQVPSRRFSAVTLPGNGNGNVVVVGVETESLAVALPGNGGRFRPA